MSFLVSLIIYFDKNKKRNDFMFLSIFFIIIGFIFLIKGADFLVEGSSNVAKKFNIPEIVIGLTIISIGTSMPELFVSITSSLDGYSDMAIGNVVGSNIVNLLFILGVSAMINPIEIKKETKFIEIPICLAITVVFIVICNLGEAVTRIDGIILIFLFILFIIYTIFRASKGEKNIEIEQIEENNSSILEDIFNILLGIIALKVGGDLAVNHAVHIANYFNLSEKIIGITILAVGTSLPELFTSVSASLKGKCDIAIGNILGSNIFNLLLIIGSSSIINPIVYNLSYNKDLTILITGTALLSLFTIISPKNKMSKLKGAIYVFMYIEYIFCLFMK